MQSKLSLLQGRLPCIPIFFLYSLGNYGLDTCRPLGWSSDHVSVVVRSTVEAFNVEKVGVFAKRKQTVHKSEISSMLRFTAFYGSSLSPFVHVSIMRALKALSYNFICSRRMIPCC